jgi:hypothetical protein
MIMEGMMNILFARWSWLLLACLATSACKDQRDPVKPTTGVASVHTAVQAAPG